MQHSDLPDDVVRFIERRIASVPHLEALLVLWENSAVSWTDSSIAERVYVSREQAQVILGDLLRHGLISTTDADPGHFIYNAGWDESQLMVSVAAAYRRHLVQLARLIHMKSG